MTVWGTAWAQLGAVGLLGVVVLWVLTMVGSGRLRPRAVSQEIVDQANKTADRAVAAAEASDRRADALQSALVEQTAAMRSLEGLVRDQLWRRPPGREGDAA